MKRTSQTARMMVVLLFGLSLAGCAAPAGPQSGPAPASMPEVGHGTLEVVVVDPTIRPLAGATVTLGDGRSATTRDDGLVRFEEVPEGAVVVTASLDGYRDARTAAEVIAKSTVQIKVKLLRGAGDAGGPVGQAYSVSYKLDGFFDCSLTYLIITGDCAVLADNLTSNAGAGTPVGDRTNEAFTLDVPLDLGWRSIAGEMFWETNSPLQGDTMTFALEPTQFNSTTHAPKYARVEGGSPLGWIVNAGEAHGTATISADGDATDMPNEAGGEVVRTRSYVAGHMHRPGGTAFLGLGAALQHEFDVLVTVFYGDPAPEGFTHA